MSSLIETDLRFTQVSTHDSAPSGSFGLGATASGMEVIPPGGSTGYVIWTTQYIEAGTVTGQLHYWDNTSAVWKHTSNLSYSDTGPTLGISSNDMFSNAALSFYRSQPSGANLNSNDLIFQISGTGMVNGSVSGLTNINAKYTGNGTTKKSMMTFGTYDTVPKWHITMQESSMYFPMLNTNGLLRVAVTTGLVSVDTASYASIGTGTTNYIPKFTSSSSIGNSLIWDSGAYIGINTIYPSNLLRVFGGSTSIATTSSAQLSLGWDNAASRGSYYGNLYIGWDNNSYLGFIQTVYSNTIVGLGALILQPDGGNIGIGTLLPTTSLYVTGIITSQSAVADTPASPTEGLRFSISSISYPDRFANSIFNSVSSVSSLSSMHFKLATGSSVQTTVMSLLGNGNVGIGVTSPIATLAIKGDTGFVMQSANPVTQGMAIWYYDHNGNFMGQFGRGYEYQNFWGYLSPGFGWAIAVQDTTGNVGIGTTAPSSPWAKVLQIYNPSNVDISLKTSSAEWHIMTDGYGYLGFAERNGGAYTRWLSIMQGGDVGIGTISPWYPLDVHRYGADASIGVTGNGAYVFLRSDLNYYSHIEGQNSSGTQIWYAGIVGSNVFQLMNASNNDLILGTNNIDRLHITNAGNVGIGITDPVTAWSNVLQIYNSSSTSMSVKTSSAEWHIMTDGYGYLGFAEYSSGLYNRRMVIAAGGNVGIGTTTPISKLSFGTIYTSTSSPNIIRIYDDGVSGMSNSFGFGLNGMYGNSGELSYWAGSGGYHNFYTATSTLTMSMNNGYVGIGTGNFQEILTVKGNIEFFGGDVGLSYGYYGKLVSSFASDTGYLQFHGGAGSGKVIGASTYGTDTQIFANATERIRILDNGNVGIGTTSPNYRLQVQTGTHSIALGGSGIYSTLSAVNNANTLYTYLFIDAIDLCLNSQGGGKVGIGTSSPDTAMLTLFGSQTSVLEALKLRNSDNTNGSGVAIGFTAFSGGYTDTAQIANVIEYGVGYDLYFKTLGSGLTTKMVIKGNGNVGIGTISPHASFEVYSGTSAEIVINRAGAWFGSPAGLKLSTNTGVTDYWTVGMLPNGTNDFYINKNSTNILTISEIYGYVGIGTNSPTAVLDVNSDVFRLRTSKTPASSTDTGNIGDICWDKYYIYVCKGSNSWVRATLSVF